MQLECEIEVLSDSVMIDRESLQDIGLDSCGTTRHHIDVSYDGLGFFEYVLSNDIVDLPTCCDPVVSDTRHVACHCRELPSSISREVRLYPLSKVSIQDRISIRHDHHISRDMWESFHLSLALITGIFFEMDRLEYSILQAIVREDSMSTIRTPIIDHDDLIERSCLSKCRQQTSIETLVFIVGWDKEGYFHRREFVITKMIPSYPLDLTEYQYFSYGYEKQSHIVLLQD